MLTASLEFLLNQWGYYVRNGNHSGIGYPARNVIHKMIKEGPGASQSTATIENEVPDDFIYIDQCYGVMKPLYRKSIYHIYVDKMSKRKAAQVCKLKRETFRVILSAAEANIDGYLKAKN